MMYVKLEQYIYIYMIHGKYMYAYDICMIESMYTYATTELKGGIYVYDYGMTCMYN